jgi:putative transposase
MPQSLAKNLIHLVFSTSKREPVLAEAVREALCAYAAGVLRDLDSPAIAINTGRDHLHALFSLSKNRPLALAQVVMELKRGTSKWLKTKGAEFANFHWRAGYGAFSIGQSGVRRRPRISLTNRSIIGGRLSRRSCGPY